MDWIILRKVGATYGNGDYDIKAMTSTGAIAFIRNVHPVGNKWLDRCTSKNVLCDGDTVIAYRKTSK